MNHCTCNCTTVMCTPVCNISTILAEMLCFETHYQNNVFNQPKNLNFFSTILYLFGFEQINQIHFHMTLLKEET
ncbi:hypothetical protein XENTR_v10018487 [Xenopus tropicalis]|nr:hypothetical protein XENTR_v10018487 [Xenopus tropicalis]